jgi:ATP-dependent metalloprotease
MKWYLNNQDGVMFGGEKFKFEIKHASGITQRLDDVKGVDEIKDEVNDLIKMLRDPAPYIMKGAKLHKGVLLFGEPGTGKTLLARSIAGEAGVNFIFCSGSDFDEMFVGVGAKRIRQLFIEARKNQPCVIFIDEIDSLLAGSRRQGGEHSSSRATINQILAEMDGFEKNENIMVIGATNHEGSLDSAAVRPGRFDKKIHVPHPDLNGRTDIFELYLNKIEKTVEIEPRRLAQMTPGFTGAEIENLVNTAITEAVHKGK